MSQNPPGKFSLPPSPSLFLGAARSVFLSILLVFTVCLSGSRAALANGIDGLQITTTPALFPAFDPQISDYVVRGGDETLLQVSTTAPAGSKVSVDGQPFQEGTFTSSVLLSEGQSFKITVNASDSETRSFYIRDLPQDFPAWTAERPGAPQAEWYIVAPSLGFSMQQQNYAVAFDNYGVPVWWRHSDIVPYDAKLLPNGNIAWTGVPIEEHRLDGSLARTINAVGMDTDLHELQPLPNGNYAIIAYVTHSPVDLSPYGGSSTATVIDNVAQVVAPDGSLVWSWSAMDHLPISNTDTERWSPEFLANPSDPFHMNSVEWDGDGYVISLRHLDTVLKVDETGKIVWKLGGTPGPESLAFQNDPYGDFGGQHDARILDDGTLTVHDNGTRRDRAPRAVRYRIDTAARTATLEEQVSDPDAPISICCGDAWKLPTGNWVMSWGAVPFVTELTPAGERAFRLWFGNFFAYRVDPVLPGILDRAALRAGMDTQFPRLPATTPAQKGDLNRDGKVSVADATVALRLSVGVLTARSEDLEAGDMNGDGDIDIGDTLAILKLSVRGG